MTSNHALLLDTHVWFRYQITPDRIRLLTARAIDKAAARKQVFISVISIWELAMLERDAKVVLDGGTDRWTQEALSKPGLSLLPFSPQIALESVYLPDPMHKDPADRILVASARIERMTLVTSDKAILTFAKATSLACLRA